MRSRPVWPSVDANWLPRSKAFFRAFQRVPVIPPSRTVRIAITTLQFALECQNGTVFGEAVFRVSALEKERIDANDGKIESI